MKINLAAILRVGWRKVENEGWGNNYKVIQLLKSYYSILEIDGPIKIIQQNFLIPEIKKPRQDKYRIFKIINGR